MIQVFRKVRHQLVRQSKLRQYLLYAFGEVLLVVIGILIALQINNWNERQKTKDEEIKLLKTFKSNLEDDMYMIEYFDKEFSKVETSIHIIKTTLEEDLPYNDSLGYHFFNSAQIWWIPRIDQELFTTMTADDLNIITNDSIKQGIISYYSFAKRKFDPNVERYARNMEWASSNLFNTRFQGLWSFKQAMVPHDYESLKTDREYLYFINSLSRQLWFFIQEPLEDARFKSSFLIEQITDELNNNEST